MDFGATRIASGVFARLPEGRLRLEALAIEPLPFATGGGDDWVDRTHQALLALRPRLKAAPSIVILGLPGHLTFSKFVRLPMVDPVRRMKIIRFEAEQSIPCALTDLVWDSLVVQEDDSGLEVMFCAAKRDVVEQLCGSLEEVGLQPCAVGGAAGPTMGAFRFNHGMVTEGPVGIVNVGGRSTTLVFVERQRHFVRMLALGGGNVTQAYASDAGLDYAAAERIKREVCGSGDSPTSGPLADPALSRAMEEFADRLAQEIFRSAMHYRRHAGARPPQRFFVTGGGARPPMLQSRLSAKLKIPVERFLPLAEVEILPCVAAEAASQADTLADLVGLAATHFACQTRSICLLPPRWQRYEKFRRRLPRLAVAGALTVAAFLPPILHYHGLVQRDRRLTADIEALLSPLREREVCNRSHLSHLHQAGREIQLLREVQNKRATWVQFIVDLQNRLASVGDVWLDKLQIQGEDTNKSVAAGMLGPGRPLNILLSGRLLDRPDSSGKDGADTYRRAQALLATLAESRFVSAVKNERFDRSMPGVLCLDLVLEVKASQPL